MNNDALTSDTATLVDELRSDAALDSVAMDRLRERLAVSLTLGQLPIASGPAARTTTAAAHGGRGLLASRFAGLGLFVLGTTVGAWGHALLGAKPERTATRDVPAPRVSAIPTPTAPATAAPPPVQAAPPLAAAALAPSLRNHAAPRSASSASGVGNAAAAQHGVGVEDTVGVDAEVRLLDEARQAIASNDGAHALAALRSHADGYPRGALVQERSALLVKALVLAGRFAEARQAAKRFAEVYPSSMLLDSVNASLRRIP
jgi:pyruvate/2-oxoglutarate dehydrogenase complex dihydrolipoamide acyltransferase (E2) component